MKTKAIYPGTFDPITLGHLDVIRRGLKLFDELVVAVVVDDEKKTLFSGKERKELVEESIKGLNNVKVKTFSGLLVEFVKKENASILLRGLREMSDFPSEFQQAIVNRKLAPNIETVFVMTNEEHFYLSSSLVKQLARHGGQTTFAVPKPVEQALKEKMSKIK